MFPDGLLDLSSQKSTEPPKGVFYEIIMMMKPEVGGLERRDFFFFFNGDKRLGWGPWAAPAFMAQAAEVVTLRGSEGGNTPSSPQMCPRSPPPVGKRLTEDQRSVR